jgi:hypothetical protein
MSLKKDASKQVVVDGFVPFHHPLENKNTSSGFKGTVRPDWIYMRVVLLDRH